jgi:hypothetical protein
VATSTKRSGSSSRATSEQDAAQPANGRATITKAALAALAGGAAVGLGRAAVNRARRPRVLGVRVPRGLTPGSLDLRKIAKQVESVAERVEHTSEDVRMASAQAKRVSKRLS